MLEYDFSVIGISEMWLNENNADLYHLNGYVTIKGCRIQKQGVQYPFIFVMKFDLQLGMT